MGITGSGIIKELSYEFIGIYRVLRVFRIASFYSCHFCELFFLACCRVTS